MLYKSKELVQKIQLELRDTIESSNLKPHVATIIVGNDRATKSFVSIKSKFAQSLSIPFDEYNFSELTTTQELIRQIQKINSDEKVTALIVQLPLPKSINKDLILESIPQRLDVDVLSSKTYKTFLESNKLLPPVAAAVLEILISLGVSYKDKAIAVVGMGALVGKPVYDMFLGFGIRPQIIDINTQAKERNNILKNADIVVSGTGVANSVTPNDVKEGVFLIDAGTSEQIRELKGDISIECAQKASLLTAVPGGVGPLTVACLFRNIVEFAKNNNKLVS